MNNTNSRISLIMFVSVLLEFPFKTSGPALHETRLSLIGLEGKKK